MSTRLLKQEMAAILILQIGKPVCACVNVVFVILGEKHSCTFIHMVSWMKRMRVIHAC